METTITRHAWATTVRVANTDPHVLRLSPDSGASQLPLITRTGFELRHIVTSQIASL
ncbi:MAG TPA: hypothetical protein VF755_11330 [Catenuloplanes sp.]|jgi:hypothetical protein